MVYKKTPEDDAGPGTKPEWTPPSDEVFLYLLQEAMFGTLPVYFAAVPPTRVFRFEPTFRPERTAEGEAVMLRIFERWRSGTIIPLWVYPKGDRFIAADDYFTLAAAEKGQPDFLPCWVLGQPSESSAAKDIQGPIKQASIREMLGIAE